MEWKSWGRKFQLHTHFLPSLKSMAWYSTWFKQKILPLIHKISFLMDGMSHPSHYFWLFLTSCHLALPITLWLSALQVSSYFDCILALCLPDWRSPSSSKPLLVSQGGYRPLANSAACYWTVPTFSTSLLNWWPPDWTPAPTEEDEGHSNLNALQSCC